MRHKPGIRVSCGQVCNLRLWRVLVNAALAGYWRFGWLDLGAAKRTNADFYRASRGVRCLGACGAAATVAEARCLFRRRAVPGPGGTGPGRAGPCEAVPADWLWNNAGGPALRRCGRVSWNSIRP